MLRSFNIDENEGIESEIALTLDSLFIIIMLIAILTFIRTVNYFKQVKVTKEIVQSSYQNGIFVLIYTLAVLQLV